MKLSKKINIQNVNILFTISLVFIFGSYILFDIGLAHEGVKRLYNIITTNKIIFFEKSRIFFHFLYQLPALTFIKFPSLSSLSILTKIFFFWFNKLSYSLFLNLLLHTSKK